MPKKIRTYKTEAVKRIADNNGNISSTAYFAKK
jgi:hypothetical protein